MNNLNIKINFILKKRLVSCLNIMFVYHDDICKTVFYVIFITL